jgi:hypothetical protein
VGGDRLDGATDYVLHIELWVSPKKPDGVDKTMRQNRQYKRICLVGVCFILAAMTAVLKRR